MSKAKKKKWIISLLVAVFVLVGGVSLWAYYNKGRVPEKAFTQKVLKKIRKNHRLTSGHVLFVDFSRPSGEYRLFIYDVRKRKYISGGCVLHGLGGGSTAKVPVFSNRVGSRCSSLGLYKVAELSKSSYGYRCLRLDGLSPTNSNARRRGILIHTSAMVSVLPFERKGQYFPLSIASEGCFSVSNTMFNKIKSLKRPIYIYAYNGEHCPPSVEASSCRYEP